MKSLFPLVEKSFLLFFICISFFSCHKENPSWNVDVVTPVAYSSLTVENIIPDSILHKNPDNSLDLVFHAAISSLSTGKIFVFPDTAVNISYVSPLTAKLPGGESIASSDEEHIVLSGNVEITHGIIRSGNMLLSVVSSVKNSLTISVNVPGLITPSGTIFQTLITIPAGTSTSAGTYYKLFDLSGYKLDATGPNGDKQNTLLINYNATLNGTDSVQIVAGDSVHFNFSLQKVVPQYAKGYFGDVQTSDPDSTQLSLFRKIIGGNLNLENVDINLVFENNIGIDAHVAVDYLYSVNSRTKTIVPLNHPIIGKQVNVTRALDNNGTVTPTSYYVSLGTANSNIKQFTENLPDSFKTHVSYALNPLGNISGFNDFGYYDKPMKMYLDMKIPLSLIANDLTLGDTINFNLGTTATNVNSATLYLFLKNGFPFSAAAQLYVLNDKFVVVDSLISSPNVIASPPLDASYICMGQQETKLTIPVGAAKMNELRSTKKLFLKIKFNTANYPDYIKIYSNYKMDAKLTADFNYTVGKK